MCTLVDARFAGGSIIVSPLAADDLAPALVDVDIPGLRLSLSPSEARALAAALVEAAGAIE